MIEDILLVASVSFLCGFFTGTSHEKNEKKARHIDVLIDKISKLKKK